MFLQASSNNLAATVEQCFIQATQLYLELCVSFFLPSQPLKLLELLVVEVSLSKGMASCRWQTGFPLTFR